MLISDLKLLLKFDSTALYEEVSQSNMTIVGDDQVVSIITNGGYLMKDNQYLLGDNSFNGYALSITNSFTLGFWLYPFNPGLTTNLAINTAEVVSMPLLNFNDISSADNAIIKLVENTTLNGNNNLIVSFNDDIYSASSENYEPSVWHFFWITYNGTSLRIYIDGNRHNLQSVSGSLPSTLSGSQLDLYVNHSVDGYAYNITKNKGYIDNVFMFNTYDTSLSNMQTVINNGVDYITDDTYIDERFEGYGIYFDDPDTITVNTSIDDMSYIYLGRNDGKILRGSPLFWEVRKDYSNQNENILVDNGFLKINNSIARF